MDRRFRLARANGTMELDVGATAEYLHRLAQRPRGSEQCLGAPGGVEGLTHHEW